MSDEIKIVAGAKCPECGKSFQTPNQVCDHHYGVHDERISEESAGEWIVSTERNRFLEALYKINKHAGKYGNRAQMYFRQGKKATARKNSIRKSALYDVKRDVIEGLHEAGEHDCVECHAMDEGDHYCHYFGEWSFHTPADEWNGPEPDVVESSTLDDFEKSSEASRTDMSLKDSLLLMKSTLGLSANDYLEEERVSYGHQSYFVGWKYLD